MNGGWLPLQGPGDPDSVTLFEMPGGGSAYSDPEFAWFDPTGPTAIAFPLGSTLGGAYDDVVLFGDFNLPGRLYALPLAAGRKSLDFGAHPPLQDGTADNAGELDLLVFGTSFDSILDVKMSPDGALFVLTYFTGRIYKITGPREFGVPVLAAPLLASLALGLLASAHRMLAPTATSARRG
jgi:hypothetical protein